ncbi:MAG: cold shock domain-containing protein [Candidatus Phytoplasma pruni]|nr:cold shock domain-containing protein [Candidatus Phytoplasma pruni]
MEQKEQKRIQGKVDWFNPDKGFGFITIDTDEPNAEGQKGNVFFHYTSIRLDNSEYRTDKFRTLEANQKVEFTIKEVEGRGLQAFDIVKVE